MGTESSKRKDETKPVKLKNTPRNSDSIQSLNINVYGSVSTNPAPSVYSQPEVTHRLTRAQSVESPISMECRCKTQQAQTITDPVQTDNNKCVHGSLQKHNTGHVHSGCNYHSSNFSPYYCHYEAQSEDNLSFKKQLINDEKLPSSSVSFRQQIFNRGHGLRSVCEPTFRSSFSASERGLPRIVRRNSDVFPRASTGHSVDGHVKERAGWYSVRNFITAQEGRVDVESQKYFFQLNKKEAEEKLLESEFEIGTYLLRRSADTGAYAFSLRCENELYELDIRHYKIRIDVNGVCYIDDDSNIKIKPFSNIMELITYYTEEPGLRCKLKTPLSQDIPLDYLAVEFSEFTMEEKLGSGNFGTVYAGTLYDNRQVAVKSLKAGGSMTVEEFRKEAQTMHKLRHPNLVSLLAICEDRGNIYIITERMSKGDLLTLLREDTDHTVKFTDLMEMAFQVAEGMCYLEKKGFVHRDLRAANVLVGDGNITKIADFGLARLLDSYYQHEDVYQEKKGAAFPYKWTAPEAAKQKKFTVKSDVWSYGILLYEMMTHGDEPYAAMPGHVVLDWLEKGNRLKRPTEHHCPMTLYNIMRQCWLKNSDERPNFADIRETLIEIKTNTSDLVHLS